MLDHLNDNVSNVDVVLESHDSIVGQDWRHIIAMTTQQACLLHQPIQQSQNPDGSRR